MKVGRHRLKALVASTAVVGLLVAISASNADSRIAFMLRNTVLLAVGTLTISIPLGTFLAFLIARSDLPGRKIFAVILSLLLLLPLYLQTGAWQAGFGLQGWFTTIGGGPELVDGLRGAIWVHGMAAIPWVALIAGIGFRLVEPAHEEEALLHASAFQVFWRVTLYQSAGAVGVAALWVTVATAGEMTVTDLFRVRTFAEEIYLSHAATGDLQSATMQVLPQVVVQAVLLLMGGLLCIKLMPRSRSIFFRPLRPYELGGWRIPALASILALFVILLAVPLANLIYKAGIDVESNAAGLPLRTWSFAKLIRMTVVEAYEQFGSEFRSSLIVGAGTAIASVVTGVLLAWLGRAGGGRAVLVGAICAVLLALPGPALGAVLSRLLVYFPPVYDSYAAPGIALWLRTLPLATLILWHAFRSLPQEALDAARLDGAGTVACLTFLAVPLRWPSLALAGLVSLIVALGDLSASQLLQVPGKETLAARVFDRLHSGAYDQVSGLFLALLLALSLAAFAVCWLATKITRPHALR